MDDLYRATRMTRDSRRSAFTRVARGHPISDHHPSEPMGDRDSALHANRVTDRGGRRGAADRAIHRRQRPGSSSAHAVGIRAHRLGHRARLFRGSRRRATDSRGRAARLGNHVQSTAGMTEAQRDSVLRASAAAVRSTTISFDWVIDQAVVMNRGGGRPTNAILGPVRAIERLDKLGPPVARLERVRTLCGV